MEENILNKGDLVEFIAPPVWDYIDSTRANSPTRSLPGIVLDSWHGEERDWYGYPNERRVYLVYWSDGNYSREYDCYLKKISSNFRAAGEPAK